MAHLNDYCVQGKDFWQGYIDKQGVCCRLAFKWLACQLTNRKFYFGWWNGIYDEKFKTELDWMYAKSQVGMNEKRPQHKKTVAKQIAYLNRVAHLEVAGTTYEKFRDGVHEINLKQLRDWSWGSQAKRTTPKYNLSWNPVKLGERVSLDGSHFSSPMILALYGDGEENWSHATAYYCDKRRKAFFDPNGGEYDVSELDDEIIAGLVLGFLWKYHCESISNIVEFILYQGAQSKCVML